MNSKTKKLAKNLAEATKQAVSKKKRKQYKSLIEKHAKKLAKKMTKKKDVEIEKESIEIVEKNVAPAVWNAEEEENIGDNEVKITA